MKKGLFQLFLGFSLIIVSCGRDDNPKFVEYFHLKKYSLKKFDFYNPILHDFKGSSIEGDEEKKYFSFDVYLDSQNIPQYSFFKSDSYGYLLEFKYDNKKLQQTSIYSCLGEELLLSENVISNKYFYDHSKVVALIDQLNHDLLLVQNDSITVYTNFNQNIKAEKSKFAINDYYVKLL